jgi:hypothetical protein
MAIRTPKNSTQNPPREKRWEQNPRGVQRKAKFVVPPDESIFRSVRRRIFRFLTHPGFFVPVIILFVSTALTLGYFWMEFSQRIDFHTVSRNLRRAENAEERRTGFG